MLLPGMACMPVLQEQKPVIDARRSEEALLIKLRGGKRGRQKNIT